MLENMNIMADAAREPLSSNFGDKAEVSKE